jgi:serine/threonine-protein kinase
MPYVEGESLRQRLERQGQLPLDEALGNTRAIASALDFAHARGVIHRDIKPENVMLHQGEPMVADFGIALAVSAARQERLTGTGISLGTPAYMSPEQASGERKLDGRSDQYSLACVLYEMLTGRTPFVGPTAQAIIAQCFTSAPPPLRTAGNGVPEWAEQAILKALAKEPGGRFATAAAFAQALKAPGAATTPPGATTATAPPLAATIPKSIAVLPFVNMSADPENEYFTDGIAEEIINALSKIQALRVASRSSAFAF